MTNEPEVIIEEVENDTDNIIVKKAKGLIGKLMPQMQGQINEAQKRAIKLKPNIIKVHHTMDDTVIDIEGFDEETIVKDLIRTKKELQKLNGN